MLGVGLQTTGVLLLLTALLEDRPAGTALAAAFVCFGLGGVHQAAVSGCASDRHGSACWRPGVHGRIGLKEIARVLLLEPGDCLALLWARGVGDWRAECRGRYSWPPASVGRIHPADWYFAGNIVLALIWKSVGIILLAAAALVAMVSTRPGKGRRLFAAAGTGLIASIAALTVLQLFVVAMWFSGLIVAGLILTMICMIPAWAASSKRRWLLGRIGSIERSVVFLRGRARRLRSSCAG